MPFLTYHSRHSWPPFITTSINASTTSPYTSPSDTIDEDPFAFFISPLSESDDPFDNLSAGISPANARSRSSYDVSAANLASKSPSALFKRWERYVERYHPRLVARYHCSKQRKRRDISDQTAKHDGEASRVPVVVEPPRGREKATLPYRGRRSSRTLSGHRHSWREPSVDLWTVVEESNESQGEADVDQEGSSRNKLNVDEKWATRARL